jgi:hypothetical protein
MRDVQMSQLASPQTAAKQYRKNRTVPLALQCDRIECLPEAAGLLSREPVPKPHAQLLDTLIGQPAHGGEPAIDGSGPKAAIFEGNSVPCHHNPVERQSWLGTVSVDEFVNRMLIPAFGFR